MIDIGRVTLNDRTIWPWGNRAQSKCACGKQGKGCEGKEGGFHFHSVLPRLDWLAWGEVTTWETNVNKNYYHVGNNRAMAIPSMT